MTDHETASAVDALTRRLRNRYADADAEVFALEFITALRARGWRPTEARVRPAWKHPAGHGVAPTADYLEMRQALDERLSALQPKGDRT